MHPLETGNLVLIVVGFGLEAGGITIIYRTIRGMIEARRKDSKAPLHWASNGLNLVIAIVFMIAGVLFVVNNLRGNPLHFKS